MQVATVVQARMSSQRLPGKVLAPLSGKPVLAWLLDRLDEFDVVVATSDDASDDPVAAFCGERRVECFRGPLADVAARFAAVVERYELDAFARVSGDSPLLDPALLRRALALFSETEPDLATNVFPRSFPPGQSVEVVDAATFLEVRPEFDERDREHVTTFFYAHPERFRIESFSAAIPYEGPSHAIDTPEDLVRVEAWARARPDASWDEIGAS